MTGQMLRGLYAVADTQVIDGEKLYSCVEAAIEGGARIVQYRDKSDQPARRTHQALLLAALCHDYGVLFLINDDVELARETGAAGVHVGRHDCPVSEARRLLGSDAIVGVSCYDSLQRARTAAADGANYVAFGRVFSSPTKPDACRVSLETVSAARDELDIPIACIGGITHENAQDVVRAGADMIAVISALFRTKDVSRAARLIADVFVDV